MSSSKTSSPNQTTTTFSKDLSLMANTLNAHVGPVYQGDGNASVDARQGSHSEAIVQQLSGKYAESTKRGNVYSANATGLTPTTSIAGTTSAPLVLYNPVGSNKRLKILKVGYGQAATGTLGTGVAFHCGFTINGPTASQSNTVPTGTSVSPVNQDLGNANQSVATVLSTATLNAAAKALYPFAQQAESVGGTTTSGTPTICVEDVDGIITLEPGSGYTIGTVAAAGSSPLIDAGIVWEEEFINS
jgi:hypothetical protein